MSDCWNPIKEIIKMSPARSWLDHNQEVKMCFYLFFTKEKILCISGWINYFPAFLARLSFPVFRLSVISIVKILIFGLFVRHYLVCIWLFTLHVNSRVKHYYPYCILQTMQKKLQGHSNVSDWHLALLFVL